MEEFKRKSIDTRLELSKKIMESHPNRVPIIVTKKKGGNVGEITKNKFIAPKDISIAKFMLEIRKHIQITPEHSIYIYVKNGIILQPSLMVLDVYHRYRDVDGFLYVSYSGENTFG